jgi:hypothetical protein
MKRNIRWIILMVIAFSFLGAFFWDTQQSYSAIDHKVVEILLVMVFLGLGWVWSSFNEISSYQEMVEDQTRINQKDEKHIRYFYVSTQATKQNRSPDECSQHYENDLITFEKR